MMQMQHQAPPPPPPGIQQGHYPAERVSIQAMNEAVWLQIGSFSEMLRSPEEAMIAYEKALSHNQNSIPALNAIGMLLKGREAFEKALNYFRAITQLDANNGEAWGNLGTLCPVLLAPMRKLTMTSRTLLPHDRRSPKGV
jgi:glucose repression mediator protein